MGAGDSECCSCVEELGPLVWFDILGDSWVWKMDVGDGQDPDLPVVRRDVWFVVTCFYTFHFDESSNQ